MIDSNRDPRRWRDAATLLLAVVLAVSVVSVVVDGGRPALAADDCQYGQYGPYGPYGQPCAKAKPTLTLSGPTSVPVGTSSRPVATLRDGAGPSSFITFRLFRPGDASCSTAAFIGSVDVNGNGNYSFSPFFPVPFHDQVGTWRWTASYAGDARNEPAATECGAYVVNVTPRSSGIFINRPSPQPVGSSVTISGGSMFFQPTGTISLRVHGPDDPSCVGTPVFSRQVAPSFFTETIGPLGVVGTWSLQLSYPGDANNLPATTPCGGFYSFDVTKRNASLALVLSPRPVTVGQLVTAGAFVAGYQPTGTLTIRFFAPSDPSCSAAVATETVPVAGSAPTTTSFVPTSVGWWNVTTEYSGDASNTPATATCGSLPFLPEKATPAVSVNAVPVLAEDGDRVHASVDLGSAYQPTGSVSFSLFPPNDSSCSGAPTYVEEVVLSGTRATTSVGVEVPKHAIGTWNWTASYSGDENNAQAASSCGQAPVEVVKKIKKEK